MTHLGIRTEFALVDSIVRIKDLIKAAKNDNQHSLAITDPNAYAWIKFYKACVGAKIKPILGLEINTDTGSAFLYAMNNTGYQNLMALLTEGYLHHQQDGAPVLPLDTIARFHDGVICALGHRSGIQEQVLLAYRQVFDDRLYLSVSRVGHDGETAFFEQALVWGERHGIPIICHGDVRFLSADDFDAHEARVCISAGYTLADERRARTHTDEQYFKTQEQMTALFADFPQIIQNTDALATRCNVSLTLGKNVLPKFPIPKEHTTESFFRLSAKQGLNARLDKLYPPNTRGEDWADIRAPYDTRLDYELGVILAMGFSGYFLIVMDFIQWAKNNQVPVGPGRGSGAGSLVAYSLGITDLDPLHYDLLFERFLNPERVSMPDFDIDFCIDGRDRVIDYVAHQYGRDAVSQIITFGTMAARAVVRDVARVQSRPYIVGDRISKLIPKTPGIKLEEALEQSAELYDLIKNPNNSGHEEALEIWEVALKLEGITRNVGKHAGGVLIAPNKISDFSPLYIDAEGSRVSQYDKDDVEAVGLVKFDFLGLRNLTVIKDALTLINQKRHKQGLCDLDLDLIDLSDKAVYEQVLQTGRTSAVFQLESAGMKKYLKKLLPTNIEDVIAMCALYRPGPLDAGMVEMYIDRKHGRERVVYDHDNLAEILENTYGVIVYQEQVMQISQTMAGYSLGGADMLRRAMGKKKPEEMAKQRSIFVDGAKGLNIDETVAGSVFDLMEKFAGYGFNKSHSAAYGLVAYQTAYLKHHYTVEFMAAVLTSDMDNTDAVVHLIDDCRSFGITVLPPSVNQSGWEFVPIDDKTIVYGLGAVKGVGSGAVASIVAARKNGKFSDLVDFCHRVDTKKVGKRALEALVNAGCFDDLPWGVSPAYHCRAAVFASIGDAMAMAEKSAKDAQMGITDLFAETLICAPKLDFSVIWRDGERLAREKATLGLYLTGHPLDEWRDELIDITPVAQINDSGKYTIAGMISDIMHFGNRSVIKMDDGTHFEISVYSDALKAYCDILVKEKLVVLDINASEYEGRIYLKFLHAMTLAQHRLAQFKGIRLHLDAQDSTTWARVSPLLTPQNDHALRVVVYAHIKTASVPLRTKPLYISAQDDSIGRLKTLGISEYVS